MIMDYRNVVLIIYNNTIEHVTQFKLLGHWSDINLIFTIHCVMLLSSIMLLNPAHSTPLDSFTSCSIAWHMVFHYKINTMSPGSSDSILPDLLWNFVVDSSAK